MSVIIKGNQFHLKTKNTSYIMGVYKEKYLLHYYWGSALNNDVDLAYMPDFEKGSKASAFHVLADAKTGTFLNDLQFEFNTVGSGDYRTPMLFAQGSDGSSVFEFSYSGYTLPDKKPKIPGMPSCYTEEGDNFSVLEIELKDNLTGLKVFLTYTVYEDFDAITRSVRYENTGNGSIKLLSALSVLVDMPGTDYNILHLPGDWAREREIEYTKVTHGHFLIDSKRGMSSHIHNPFVALLRNGADERKGEVFGFSLVYSGSFKADIEGDTSGSTRVCMGINDFNFSWNLSSNDVFYAPETVLVYSDGGIGKMSNIYHDLYRKRLCRGKWRDLPRPTVANNWEGTGYDFDEKVILDIAKNASSAGIEMFVVDDGWYGKRKNELSSLGDWYENKEKLPNGLSHLVDEINRMGMKFGLWFEPEMVSPDSELYRKHPDWCIYAQDRSRTLTRHQLILDLSKKEVCDYVVESVVNVLKSANIEYVKWDCNRNITETRDFEQTHRYVLGLYDVLERITESCPDVLFESCSGGGGRFDPGMLYYMPQTWTSDQTDPVPRLHIQTGTSVVYPILSMTAHVASCVTDRAKGNRDDVLKTASYVSMAGNFGLEMDLRKLTEDEIEKTKEYVREYKEIRNTVSFGKMYRLEDYTENGDFSFQFTDDDMTVIFTYQTHTGRSGEKRRIYPRGLLSDAKYECDGKVFYGDELMKFGIAVKREVYDFAANKFIYRRVK